MNKVEQPLDRVKGHPIYVFLAGAAMSAMLMWQYAFPAYLGSERYYSEAAKELVANANNEKSKAQREALAAQAKISSLSAELTRAQALAVDALVKSPFHLNNPYPIGLGDIKVGDKVALIDLVFAARSIDKSKRGYWSVDTGHGLIFDATFFLEGADKSQLVWQIMYFVSQKAVKSDKEYLFRALVAALGRPVGVTEDGRPYWHPTPTLLVRSRDFSFVVTGNKRSIATGSIKR